MAGGGARPRLIELRLIEFLEHHGDEFDVTAADDKRQTSDYERERDGAPPNFRPKQNGCCDGGQCGHGVGSGTAVTVVGAGSGPCSGQEVRCTHVQGVGQSRRDSERPQAVGSLTGSICRVWRECFDVAEVGTGTALPDGRREDAAEDYRARTRSGGASTEGRLRREALTVKPGFLSA
jgi:hypothetical protein